ncbi:DDE-type integrase/transposase/recombinase [Streptomyces griseomycini]|uniref:DDE-type integrase/transposase/recombinase n=1 Tax=Streptomyces griseomycini TaxID=66895 RepID=UPI001874255A
MATSKKLTVLHLASRGAYGVPRVHAELRRLGYRINRKRIERIMRERGRARGGPARAGLHRPGPRDEARRRHHLHRHRRGLALPGDQATWLDLATREIVGYSMVDHHRASLVVDALVMAAGRSRLQPGCIAHPDRGSEYTSDELRREIRRLGLRQSMGRTGSCLTTPPPSVLRAAEGRNRHRCWPDRTSPERGSTPSSRPSTTAGDCGSIRSGAISPRWRSGNDTSKDTPSRRKHRVSNITGKPHCFSSPSRSDALSALLSA